MIFDYFKVVILLFGKNIGKDFFVSRDEGGM